MNTEDAVHACRNLQDRLTPLLPHRVVCWPGGEHDPDREPWIICVDVESGSTVSCLRVRHVTDVDFESTVTAIIDSIRVHGESMATAKDRLEVLGYTVLFRTITYKDYL